MGKIEVLMKTWSQSQSAINIYRQKDASLLYCFLSALIALSWNIQYLVNIQTPGILLPEVLPVNWETKA